MNRTFSPFSATLLRKNGYDVCEACDGVEGMKKVIEEKPDLVCLDLLMPEKTGIKMYREMRKDEQLKKIPVIMVTGIESADPWDFKDFKKFIQERSIPPSRWIHRKANRQGTVSEGRKGSARRVILRSSSTC